jgi:hypothetical protein
MPLIPIIMKISADYHGRVFPMWEMSEQASERGEAVKAWIVSLLKYWTS